MKLKKNYLKALITFPILSLAISMPISMNAANVALNNISKENTQQEASKAAASGQGTTTQSNLTLDLNAQIDKQYNANKFYVQNDMPSIANANGPILLGDNGRSIAAYDWYGNPSWFLNLNSSNQTGSTLESSASSGEETSKPKYDAQASYYKYSNALSTQINWAEVGTKIVDTAYLASRDFLYVLTDTSYLFLIQSTTGTINSVKKLEHSINKIALIDFNNSLYGWNSTQSNSDVYNIDTQKLTLTTAITNAGSGIANKYLFDILPLGVGYNIALYSDNALTNPQSAPITLKAKFIQDDGKEFKKSTGENLNGNGEKSIQLDASIKSFTDIYSTTLKKSSDSYVLIVGNKVYSIVLNKSAMENTTFTELTTASEGAKAQSAITLKSINSAFIDESGLIYLKDASTNIYQITLDNKITNGIAIPTSGSSYVFDADSAKKARIYSVNKSGNEQIARKGTGYIASPEGFKATGFMNGSVLTTNFNSTIKRPSFSLPNNFKSSAPSSFEFSNITVNNATGADQYNTQFFSDDISGELYVKTRLSVQAWYDTSIGATTSSYVIGKWNCAKIETVTKWVGQTQFNSIAGGLFAKRSPQQISDEDVTKYADQILNLPSVVTSSDYKKINIIITNKVNENQGFGEITLKATITYKNKKGTIVSYMMKENTYKVKKEASTYKFQFYGGLEDNPDSPEVDVSSLGTEFTNFKNTIPSLIDPSSDNLQAFIKVEDKYPTDSRRVISVTNADDNAGTLSLRVHYNNLANTTQSVFTITYTGFATLASNKVYFEGENIPEDKVPTYDGQAVYPESAEIKDITTITQYKNYNELLATDIDASRLNLVYKSNLSLMGFNPEVSIEIDQDTGTISSHDAEYGSINVVLDYRKSKSELLGITLPEKYWNNFDLQDGVIKQRYIGFLPIGATYGVELKSYNSPEVQNVVQNNNVNADIAPTQLISTLDIRGYNTEGQTPNITVQNFSWNGENLTFAVHAQSTKYNTVTTDKTFTISWSPKFAAIRQRNLIISSTTSVAGVAIVSAAIAMYILRRNKIRRMMK